MLHNTGPYGPNETPVNMGASINIPELSSPMNIAQNFNNIMKMSHQASNSSAGHFNFPNYPGFAGASIANAPQMKIFSNPMHRDIPPAVHAPNTSFLPNSNGTVSDPFSFNNEYDQDAMDFSNFTNRLNNLNHALGQHKPRNMPLNVPQISIKDIYNQFGQSSCTIADKQYKQSDKLTIPWTQVDVKSEVHDHQSEVNNDSGNANNISMDAQSCNENSENSHADSPIDLQSNSNVENTEYNHNATDDEDVNDSDMSDSNFDARKQIESYRETNEITRQTDDEMSDADDSKPLNLISVIKQEPTETNEAMDSTVVVKVEQIYSWTDTEHMQPFMKDVSGVIREDSSCVNVVDCTKSVAQATEIIQNGSTTNCLFECPNCCLLFAHPKRFLIHTKWHSFGLINERRMEEAKEKIERRRESKKQLKKKEETDGEAEPAYCKLCEKTFANKTSLNNHRQKFHPNREHECKICHITVLGWYGLRNHMATHTSDGGFQCDACPKKFKHAHSLAKHRDTHLEKIHACAECPKKFGSQVLLKMHMKCHERMQRGPTFSCTYCAKGFYEAYTLQIHERTHRNERPFQCDICNTSYGTNSSLKRHLKVSHSQAKPFECLTCHRCFVTALIRDRHAARAHGTPGALQHACTKCSCRYLRLKDLRRHMYRIHPKGKKRRKSVTDSEHSVAME